MKIGLDIMGGDYAPAEAIKGVHDYFEQVTDSSVHLVLIGNTDIAAPFLSSIERYSHRYTVVHATQVVDMDDSPVKVFKEKPDSSMAVGFDMLQQGNIDAFISVGNTGAMMVGAMYSVKTIEGILRPTIATPIPREDGRYNLLVDSGINADCKPENLVQFAQLASLYMQYVEGIGRPLVGLLNIGEEEGKGNLLAQATFPLLKENPDINFSGNIEGRDIFLEKADVIVCEGFVGNVILKMAESIYDIFKKRRKVSDSFLDNFNFEIYGGTPILGINKPVVIGHGISHALAFKNTISAAAKIISSNLTEAFRQRFATSVQQ